MALAETSQIVFEYKEVIEALLRQQGITDGLWSLYIEFGIGAANVGPSKDDLRPAAIVPILKIGITRGVEESNMTVDASKLRSRSGSLKKDKDKEKATQPDTAKLDNPSDTVARSPSKRRSAGGKKK